VELCPQFLSTRYAVIASAPLLVIGFVIYGFGESSFDPSVGTLISRRVGPGEQGRV